jgi:hypothetical protein
MRETLALAKRFIEHAPADPGPMADGIVGWNGRGVNVCCKCAGRIMARGCDFKAIATTPVWAPEKIICELC